MWILEKGGILLNLYPSVSILSSSSLPSPPPSLHRLRSPAPEVTERRAQVHPPLTALQCYAPRPVVTTTAPWRRDLCPVAMLTERAHPPWNWGRRGPRGKKGRKEGRGKKRGSNDVAMMLLEGSPLLYFIYSYIVHGHIQLTAITFICFNLYLSRDGLLNM